MKRILFIIIHLVATNFLFSANAQKKPDWLTERPNGAFYYIGIGSASKSSSDYQQKAKQNAIAELVSEIEIKVSVNSLVTTMEKDDESVSSYFSEVIQTSVSQHIKDFEQVDNWQDDQTYWVYYRLDKEAYAEQMKQRREQAIKEGFNYWYNGDNALKQGDLITAIDFFIKGLSVIEPCANEDLSCSYNGQTILVGNVLYTSLKNVFNGIRMTPSPSEIQASAFQATHTPIKLTIEKEGIPLRNLPLKGEFVSGMGTLSEIPPTGNDGVSTTFVQNISSKNAQQEIRYTLNIQPFLQIKSRLMDELKKQLIANTPNCSVMINNNASKEIRAYLQPLQKGNEGLLRGVQTLLTNNYFNITDTKGNADVIVLINSEFAPGNIVNGDVYNMKEYFTTVSIQIKNNRSGEILVRYQLEKRRTLSPANASLSNAQNAAIREVLKVINREFSKLLKDVKIDTQGEIPQEKKEPVQRPQPAQPNAPAPQPVIVVQPTTPSTSPVPKPIQAELEPGIFISYIGKKDLNDRTILNFKIENNNKEEYMLTLFANTILIVNEMGEEVKCNNIKIGSRQGTYSAEGTIVPGTPTQLEIEIKKTKEAALFQLTNANRRTIKLRNLK